jgi:hypothetical protein
MHEGELSTDCMFSVSEFGDAIGKSEAQKDKQRDGEQGSTKDEEPTKPTIGRLIGSMRSFSKSLERTTEDL